VSERNKKLESKKLCTVILSGRTRNSQVYCLDWVVDCRAILQRVLDFGKRTYLVWCWTWSAWSLYTSLRFPMHHEHIYSSLWKSQVLKCTLFPLITTFYSKMHYTKCTDRTKTSIILYKI